MRIYELVFIVKPDLPEGEMESVIEQFTSAVSEGGGTVMKVEQWGKRRLAYRVKRHDEGYYVLMHYSTDANTSLAREIERRLRVSDPVIKYITIRIDEELKRLEKLKKKNARSDRAARELALRAGRRPLPRPLNPRPRPASPTRRSLLRAKEPSRQTPRRYHDRDDGSFPEGNRAQRPPPTPGPREATLYAPQES